MKKLMMLAAMLAMALALAVPVLAQDITQESSVASEGDNSNQCAPISNAANTGNIDNEQSVEQYASVADDISFEEAGAIEVSPGFGSSCTQTVEQAAAAG